MRETWYVLEDGSAVHPSEVTINKHGALAHKNGLVEMRGETPRSRGVDVNDRTGKQAFDGKGDHDGDEHAGGAKKNADMKPAPKPTPAKNPGYKTRGTK